MATDPYHNFAADLQSSLSAARQLAQHYGGLKRRHGGAEEMKETYARLQDSLEALENDIGDVRESVQMVEARGPERFGVEPAELARRKAFVRDCEQEMAVSVVVGEKERRLAGMTDTPHVTMGRAKEAVVRLSIKRCTR